MTMHLTRRGLAGLAAASLCTPALAQGRFPTRDLTWLIYQSPGGSIDVTTRMIQPFLEARGFKSQLEYATGAGGRVARTRLFTNRPDGYTIMTEVAPGVSVDTALFEVPYAARDFAPIFGWQSTGGQLNVQKNSPIRSMADFVAECRRRRVVVGSIGRGGAHHLQLLAMRRDLGIPFDIAHFNGSSAAYAQVIGGHIDASIGGPASGSTTCTSSASSNPHAPAPYRIIRRWRSRGCRCSSWPSFSSARSARPCRPIDEPR